MMKIKIVLLLSVFMAFMFMALSFSFSTSFAATYGTVNIIDDGVMNNVNTMSASQINSFLNSFSGTCLGTSSGFTTPDPKGYSSGAYQFGGNVDAGTAVRNIAIRYNLNPQVLITTLEKEQGLISRNGNCNYNNPAPAAPTASSPCNYSAGCSFACQNSPVGGCTAVAVGYACSYWCDVTFNGFSKQISGGAWVLRFAEARAYGMLSGYLGYDTGDEYICYVGPMTQGYRQRSSSSASCKGAPGNQSIYYDGSYTDQDGNTMYIANGATASMLNYTPFYARSYTNDKLFHTSFTRWFGSTLTYIPPSCNSQISNVGCVWQLNRPASDSNFLTLSTSERDTSVTSYNYLYDSMPFYAYSSQQSGTVPIYRLRLSNEHFYTSSESEKNSLLQNPQNTFEGVAFYMYPSSNNSNLSYPVYRLNNSAGHLFVSSTSKRDLLIGQGYTYEGIAFNAPSALISPPVTDSSHLNVYRLSNGNQHLYSTDLSEADSLMRKGWKYEGILLQSPTNATSTPVYRLFGASGDHIFTAYAPEKDNLVKSGWIYEGVAWYVDNALPPTFRFYIAGYHFYTTDLNEAFSISNNKGSYEGVAFGSNPTGGAAIYRLFNGNYHFFTQNIEEALSIANIGWKYEGVAWYASPTANNLPVYRLNGPYHFYTTSISERDQLISRGWKYEGVAWYASPTANNLPVYRLNGPYHFYTTSISERDQLISRGWKYEGVAWYSQ